MKGLANLASLVLLVASCGATAKPPARAEPQVDRLVSRHLYKGDSSQPSFDRRSFDSSAAAPLEKRTFGFANGGNKFLNGWLDWWGGFKGGLKNKKNYEISFYHLNDVHAHLDEFRPSGASCNDITRECVGGYARVKALLDKERPTKKNNLLLNAGDEFQGTLFYTLFKGEAISAILNQIGFDAFALGNHEFDDGDDLLAEFLGNLTFPALCANIQTRNRALAKKLLPFKIWPQHKLAIFSVLTPDTKTISKPGESTTFEDPIVAAKRTVKFLKRYHPSINRIVALTHIGYEYDIELAKQTTGISLIVGGHSHTLLANSTLVPAAKGPYPTIVDNAAGEEVFVVTSYRWGEYIGYIDVEYDGKGRIVSYEGAPIHLKNQNPTTVAEDPKVKATAKKFAEGFIEYARTVVGYTTSPLDQTACQTGECTMGDLITDALAALSPSNTSSPYGEHTDPPPGTKFAGAIMNAGGIRASIDGPGNVSLQHVLEAFPFGNSVTELRFTGRELWRIFEGIASQSNLENGLPVTSFVQVSSSMRVAFDLARPQGSRLLSLSVADGESIEGQDGANSGNTYIVATIDYLATGGDSFWPPKSTSEFVTLGTIDEVLIRYFKELGAGTADGIGRVDVALDGRIVV